MHGLLQPWKPVPQDISCSFAQRYRVCKFPNMLFVNLYAMCTKMWNENFSLICLKKKLPSFTQQGARQCGEPFQGAGIPRKARDIEHLTKLRSGWHKMSWKCKFMQIDMHHSKAVIALLCQKLATGETDMALIQKPRVYGDWIRGLCTVRGVLSSAGSDIASRSCIFIRNTVRVMMVKMTYTREMS